MINFEKMNATKKKRKKAQIKSFNLVLKKCIKKIELVGSLGEENCWFVVPNIMLGYPSYDKLKCLKFIENQLKIHKFKINVYEPILLYIDWSELL